MLYENNYKFQAQQDVQGGVALHSANLSPVWLGPESPMSSPPRALGSAVLGELLGEGRDAPSHRVGKGGTLEAPNHSLRTAAYFARLGGGGGGP